VFLTAAAKRLEVLDEVFGSLSILRRLDGHLWRERFDVFRRGAETARRGMSIFSLIKDGGLPFFFVKRATN
jgi:hypothetical protein